MRAGWLALAWPGHLAAWPVCVAAWLPDQAAGPVPPCRFPVSSRALASLGASSPLPSFTLSQAAQRGFRHACNRRAHTSIQTRVLRSRRFGALDLFQDTNGKLQDRASHTLVNEAELTAVDLPGSDRRGADVDAPEDIWSP